MEFVKSRAQFSPLNLPPLITPGGALETRKGAIEDCRLTAEDDFFVVHRQSTIGNRLFIKAGWQR